MKGETILFKFLGSSRVFTQAEVQDILKVNPDSLFMFYPISGGDPLYKFLGGSDALYTLSEIWEFINKNPLLLLTVYQSNRGSPCRENNTDTPMKSIGDIDGKTALLKFG